MADTVKITSTSRNTAVSDDIILRQKENVRMVFRPLLVNNPKNNAYCVKGHIIYQKKSRSEVWQDTKAISLSSLKSGEGMNLELKSEELFTLIKNLVPLYKIYHAHGILLGENEFVLTPQNLAGVLKQIVDDSENLGQLLANHGDALLKENFRWLAKNSNNPNAIQKVLQVGDSVLNDVDALIGLARIRSALAVWSQNGSNGFEDFWQNVFTRSPWILCHATSYPVIFMRGKAYVGGKTIENRNGNVLDFLYKNKLTENSVLIEIKTPMTPLLGPKYRGNSYSVSNDLSGGVNQLLSYRDSLMKESSALVEKSKEDLKVYYPRCILVIGHFKREMDDATKQSSFEIFRGELKNVEVVTFDELFARIEHLTQIVEDRMEEVTDEDT